MIDYTRPLPRVLSKKEINALIQSYRVIVPISFADLEYDIFAPQNLSEYIGQEEAKNVLSIIAQAASLEGRKLPNLLLSGSSGLGKTTLAKLLLKDEKYTFTDGNAVNNTFDKLSGYTIVDEIHNIKPEICDSLNITIDQGLIRIIGCTTNPGMLPSPFRSRFRSINLTQYTENDLVRIMRNVLNRKKSLTIDRDFLFQVALKERKTPRTALYILSFIMDVMVVNGNKNLNKETFNRALEMMGLDDEGLLPIDRRYLAAFPDNGQAVGLQYLSAVTGIDKETIEEEVEPWLMALKKINRTSKGRVLIREV